jgi:hypothetical protein
MPVPNVSTGHNAHQEKQTRKPGNNKFTGRMKFSIPVYLNNTSREAEQTLM